MSNSYENFQELKAEVRELVEKVEDIDKKLAIQTVQLDRHAETEQQFYQELKNISETLVRNTNSLEHHIKRTDMLEESINPLVLAHEVKKANKKTLIFLTKIVGGIVGILTIASLIAKYVM